jgi:hypothetical protein
MKRLTARTDAALGEGADVAVQAIATHDDCFLASTRSYVESRWIVLAACLGPRAQKLELFVFERIRGAEEPLQFVAGAGWKVADVLQIRLERRAV